MKNNISQFQLALPGFGHAYSDENRKRDRRINRLEPNDTPFHNWYRFVLSFPPHLVRRYIRAFGIEKGQTVLDPFCGTGTTLVESKLMGIRSIGLEANPFPCFASSVKTDWRIDLNLLKERTSHIADATLQMLRSQGIDDNLTFRDIRDIPLKKTDPDTTKLLVRNSVSPVPLHKFLVLRDCLKAYNNEPWYSHAMLALAKALVFSVSNLSFGPEVGVRKIKADVPVVSSWLSEIGNMGRDMKTATPGQYPASDVCLADARRIHRILDTGSVDAVITSPPYPNEKDYTRTTRLESVLLGFIRDKNQLRALKKTLVRSNTRGVYKDDRDDERISDYPEIQSLADRIENRRIELGKTSGFERQYARVTRLYFGGMARHLAGLRSVLRPGAQLAYIVGDQASYFRVMIRTGKLLAQIAESLGYELIRTDLFRTRFSTVTRKELREEVVVLRWPD